MLLMYHPGAHPLCNCCMCMQAVSSGANIDEILFGPEAGAEQLLGSQGQLDSLLAAAAAQQQQLQAATIARLTAKLLVGDEVPKAQLWQIMQGGRQHME